ncbi:MAG TPA: hypothetical protein VKX46_07215 [Ktedonobacteraceae bacterium]|nr:hypothetical protein [Ktedonobacteraceae bacterium]HLI69708.1 hypothetical protein [Ktedonobacteraceae bacterium]
MSLLLTAPQCFFLVILIFAVVGFQRGWKRELVSLGFSLGAILFLYLGGGGGLAQFIFVRLPVIAQIAVNNSGSTPHATTTVVSSGQVLITTIVAFVVIIGAGYLIGNKAFPKPTQPAERLLGILPAVISGYFIMLYVTNVLTKASAITLGVSTPSQGTIGNYMLIIFIVAVVVVVAALIATNAKKSSGGGGKK